MCTAKKWKQHIGNIARIIRLKKIPRVHNNKMEAQMIDIVTNNVRQIGTPADEGRVYISEKAYKMIKGESFRDREVYVLMGHTESSGGRYATFVESAIPVHTIEFERNTPQWTNKVWNEVFQKIKREYEELIIVGWALCQKNFPAEPTPQIEYVHHEHFGGAHQLLFLLNTQEAEENFYIRKNNHLKRKSGFFVYYKMELKKPDDKATEENPVKVELPDEFEKMIREKKTEEIMHTAVQRGKYREIMRKKGEEVKTHDENSKMSTMMIAIIAAAVVIIGISAKGYLKNMSYKEKSVPAVSTEQQLIPVEKISGQCYTD